MNAVTKRSSGLPSLRSAGVACAAGLLLPLLAACGSTGGGGAAGSTATPGAGGSSAAKGSAATAAAPSCTDAKDSVCLIAGDNPVAHGLAQEQAGGQVGDSEYHTATTGGRPSFVFDANSADGNNPVSYLYFQVDPNSGLLSGSPSALYLTVTYYDAPAGGQVWAEYDSTDTTAPVNGAYKSVATQITTTGTNAWKSVTWSLPQADFQEKENGASDFRLDGKPGVAVGSVVVSTKPPAGAKPV